MATIPTPTMSSKDSLFSEQTWSIGEVIRQIREDLEISISQLADGLCSPATLSRIECGERDPDFMLMEALLSRLGYNPNKFEMIGTSDEFRLYDMRLNITNCYNEQNFSLLHQLLKTYIQSLPKEKTPPVLHWQFIKNFQGLIALSENHAEDAVELLRESISYTLPTWHEKWYSSSIAGLFELQILQNLSDAYELSGDDAQTYELRYGILQYLDHNKVRKDQIPQLYTNVVCKTVPYLLNHGFLQNGLTLCEEGLQALSDTSRLFHWDDLLHLKGQCLERLMEQGFPLKRR